MGYGVTENDDDAFKWYCKAADQGFAPAQRALGYCYAKGYGVTPSDEKKR
ncbi:hypothetical protein AGMMS50229_20750 [Campylobacterota bacterium]|nr:hypothetical protein AGMMS50229_20750 [Campylobacterota bacterium]